MTARSARPEVGVGYVLPTGELARGAIEPLHAIDPATGLSSCGKPLSIMWTDEDARGMEPDCPACLVSLGEGPVQ